MKMEAGSGMRVAKKRPNKDINHESIFRYANMHVGSLSFALLKIKTYFFIYLFLSK